MTHLTKVGDRPSPFFWGALIALFLVSLALRFWGLSRFNALVFDEVYYAKFSVGFLQGRQEFGGHPPLSTYLIAGGIWLSEQLEWGDQLLRNSLTGMDLATFSYRWLNALSGAFVPPVVAAIAYQLIHRQSYALIAGLFATLEGMSLVESRYALNNIYLLLFGLLGHLTLLLAAKAAPRAQFFWLTLSGISFGASINIKWNGMGFLLGAYLIWAIAWVVQFVTERRTGEPPVPPDPHRSALHYLTDLNIGHILYGLAAIPAIAYYLMWIPYMAIDPETDFWNWQGQVLGYHNRVGGMEAHPYCSPWYTWPLMIRPVAYFYRTTKDNGDPTALVGLNALPGGVETVFNVHSMGNPFLWWLSTFAMLVVVGAVANQVWLWAKNQLPTRGTKVYTGFNAITWTLLYLTVNWAANWLPWIKVTRCVFLYHYLGSAFFALMALALLVDRWQRSHSSQMRTVGSSVIVVILAAFVFWLPFFLGLPLSPLGVQIRRWFLSWV